MSLIDQFRLEDLINESERLVLDELELQLQQNTDPELCVTPECVLDMAACALNAVTPMYRVNLMGRIYADAISEHRRNEIRTAVTEAIQKVRQNPPNA